MVDPNRKINRLTDKDLEFLDECEEEFKDRFTENDEEFMEYCKREIPAPPIIDPWRKGNFHDGGRGGDSRDNYKNRNFYNRRGGGNNSGYRRNHFRHNEPYSQNYSYHRSHRGDDRKQRDHRP